MVFCKLHSKPIKDADGSIVSWTEPTIIRTNTSRVSGEVQSMHLLDCGEEYSLPNGATVFARCQYTADQMRFNRENATAVPDPEPVVAEVEGDEALTARIKELEDALAVKDAEIVAAASAVRAAATATVGDEAPKLFDSTEVAKEAEVLNQTPAEGSSA